MNLKQTFCTLALAALFTTVTPLLVYASNKNSYQITL